MTKMNPRAKQLWLEWLKDHEGQEGANHLRNMDDEFCCLGGLCEVAVAEGVIPPATVAYAHYDGVSVALEYRYGRLGQPGTGSLLPVAVVEWAGLDTTSGWFDSESDPGTSEKYSLPVLNDTYRLPFSDIRTLIDEVL